MIAGTHLQGLRGVMGIGIVRVGGNCVVENRAVCRCGCGWRGEQNKVVLCFEMGVLFVVACGCRVGERDQRG